MNEKRAYIWQLARFLTGHSKQMSGGELGDHLNRNGFTTEYGTSFSAKRGVFTLIRSTYLWLESELKLPDEAAVIAAAYVNAQGKPAYESNESEEK